MPLIQLDGDPSGEPAWVNMEYVVHPVPYGADLPESHIDCTKVHDAAGPSEYVAHLYVHEGPPEDSMSDIRSILADVIAHHRLDFAEQVADVLLSKFDIRERVTAGEDPEPGRDHH